MQPLIGRSSGKRAAGTLPAARIPHAPGRDAVARPLDTDGASELLNGLGFLLVAGRPLHEGTAYLMVALRPRPTRRHFDPEIVKFWTSGPRDAELVELSWAPTDADRRLISLTAHSWGTIEVADRVPVVNRFVSFGGSTVIARRTDRRVIVFSSDAPILALGGHSGPADPLAASISGFFARLRAAAGWDARIAKFARRASPSELYAMYLHLALARYGRGVAYDVASPAVVSLLRSERVRLSCADPTAAEAGRQFAALIERGLEAGHE